MIEEKWLTIHDAAQLIGCSEDHVRLLARNGTLDSQKLGKRMWLLEKDSVVKFALEPQKTGRPRKFKKSS